MNILMLFSRSPNFPVPKAFLAVGTITSGGLTSGFHFELSLKISFRENMYNVLSSKQKFQPSSLVDCAEVNDQTNRINTGYCQPSGRISETEN